VESARQAQKGWAALDFRERRNHVTRVRDFITAQSRGRTERRAWMR
jgi:acyl-CoA reductase-like NAD-dependent aldehyde dehydrogenase